MSHKEEEKKEFWKSRSYFFCYRFLCPFLLVLPGRARAQKRETFLILANKDMGGKEKKVSKKRREIISSLFPLSHFSVKKKIRRKNSRPPSFLNKAFFLVDCETEVCSPKEEEEDG